MLRQSEERLGIERWIDPSDADTLASDVRLGLSANPKWLPPKHFYDEAGGELFERICALPEYYPTRAERALLEAAAAEIAEQAQARVLVELGSGSSAKTRLLLEAMAWRAGEATYVPLDVNESLLTQSALALTRDYPWLRVRAVVADFERPLGMLPQGPGTLGALLGGTIGNFEREAAASLLRRFAERLGDGAFLVVGTDMVKEARRLERAYDDSQGVTAAFNLNVLSVINRRLGANFDLTAFEHLARWNRELQQVEMHLRSKRRQTAWIRALNMEVDFRAGETIRTEISRKFTARSGWQMLEDAGLTVRRRWDAPNQEFCLWMGEVTSAAAPAAPFLGG